MNLDQIKNDYKKMRAPEMEITVPGIRSIEELIQKIMKQDREDERYILKRKIIPLSFGLLCLTIVALLVNIPNIVVLTGCVLIYAGLISILLRFLVDYKKISGVNY